jgi:rod shape determining protein RodA
LYWHPRYLKNWDWWLSLFTVMILAGGMAIMRSAVLGFDPEGVGGYLIRQGAAVALGFLAWIILGLLDYTDLRVMYWILYGFNVLILVAVLLFGVELNGSKSWIDLKVFMVQPAELSKVLLVVTLSKHLDDMERLTSWWDLLTPVLHVLPIVGLVVLQGDLGTAMVIAAVAVVLVYCAGFPGKKILLAGILGAALVVGLVMSHYRWGTNFPLKDYQWQRIHVFLYPEADPTDRGYQVMQSKVAIGSGGLLGRGYGQGTQNKLGYLPYQHTDFIFAVLAEEFGFAGGFTVLMLYGLIFFRIGNVAQQARDRYGALMATGVAALLGAHVLENIGMTLGVTPVTGIPLPFISYGPTALLANLLALGLVQSIAIHRDTLTF